MTPEARAKSALHFLDEYLSAREKVMEVSHYAAPYWLGKAETAKSFLGTALVALVTDAQRKVDE